MTQTRSLGGLGFAGVTLEAALADVKGVGPGFDTLRVLLSIAVVVWHSVPVSYGPVEEARVWHETVGGALAASVLPMFFSLSGFLVIGSALRTRSLSAFLTFRILRIAPALFTEVVLSALVLGPLLTSWALRDYFSAAEFWRYFANVVGWISYRLPGVFETNPTAVVNVSLWTIPPELGCYLFISVGMLTGIYLARRRMLVVMLIVLVTIGTRKLLSHEHVIVAAPGQDNLFLCFILGSLLYLYRERIVLDARLCAVAFVVGAYCIQNPVLIYIGSFFLAYCVVYLGMCRLPRLPGFDRGDYSYGIYLYGYPVQQTVAHLFPATRVWFINALVSLPLIVLLAVFSWHVIERRALTLKKLVQRRRAAVGVQPGSGVPRMP